MLKYITPPILKEMIRLQREACEAECRANAGRPIWMDFASFPEPTPLSPEESAYRDFLFTLPEDVLCELQDLYWLGCERTPKARFRRGLECWLDYSRRYDDDLPGYLHGKNIHLAEALEWSLDLLGWSTISPSTDRDAVVAIGHTIHGNS